MRDDQIHSAIATAIQGAVSIPDTPAGALAGRLADVLTPVVAAIRTDAVLADRARRDDEREARARHFVMTAETFTHLLNEEEN